MPMLKISLPLRQLILLVLFFCVYFGFPSLSLAADDVAIVEITASPAASYPLSTTFKIRLSARTINEPTPSEECGTGQPRGWSEPQWTWTAPSGGTIVSVSGQPDNVVDLQLSFGAVGPKSVNVTASVRYTSNCGTRSGSKTRAVGGFQVVGVGSIQWKRSGEYVSETSIPDILQGSTLTFKAIADPIGAPFPSGYPTWSGSATSGAGVTKNGTFSPPAGAGNRTVTAICGNQKSISIGVVSNASFNSAYASAELIVPPSYRQWMEDDALGFTDVEYASANDSLVVGISACRDGNKWMPIITSVKGYYSIRSRLNSLTEVTGPGTGGNTTGRIAATATTPASEGNSAAQVEDLNHTARWALAWYMISAVQAHEKVHGDHADTAIKNVAGQIEGKIEPLSVSDIGQGKGAAISMIMGTNEWNDQVEASWAAYKSEWESLLINDHGPGGTHVTAGTATGPAYLAERDATAQMRTDICDFRETVTPALTPTDACSGG